MEQEHAPRHKHASLKVPHPQFDQTKEMLQDVEAGPPTVKIKMGGTNQLFLKRNLTKTLGQGNKTSKLESA